MSVTLFINCCPRKDSRTKKLAEAVLSKLGDYTELNLYETDILPIDEAALNRRTKLLKDGVINDDMFALAHQFANADRIVIAAPFWDGSFPSILKVYFENIYVVGIVSCYSDKGIPMGLCRGQSLTYVTTAGGFFDGRFGYDYIKALCQNCFGIKEVSLVKAEMLDIAGNDAEAILSAAIRNVNSETI